MFNFLKSNKRYEPLHKEARKYFENNLLWLIQEFPEPGIEDRMMLTPTSQHFPINWNKTKENAFEVLDIICTKMQIEVNDIDLDFFNSVSKEINTGTSVIFMESDPQNIDAAGLYHLEKIDGKYQIAIEEVLVEKPSVLIATIAHELSHLKLLGEKKLDNNDEMLTDFTTVFFGFGIFNANAAFEFYNQSDRWSYNSLGYLKIDEWAYALALFAFARNEDSPQWKKYLSKSVKSDFEKCLRYLIENEKDIFKFDEERL